MMNPNDLTQEIGATVMRIAATDLSLLAGYSAAKARSIASFSLLIGEAYARGDLSDDEMRDELAELDRMIVRFARNLRALAATTLERIRGAVRALVFGLLARMAGLSGLVLPLAGADLA